jgi:hypothetical protein
MPPLDILEDEYRVSEVLISLGPGNSTVWRAEDEERAEDGDAHRGRSTMSRAILFPLRRFPCAKEVV